MSLKKRTLSNKEVHMNRFLSKRNILILTVFLAAILLAIYFETRPRLAPG